jgi:uroporphyrinogen-III synthase
MQQNKINILSTRPLPEALINKAASKNIFIEPVSFIETEILVDNVLKEKVINLFHQQLTVVFTSMNAVKAVAGYLNNNKPHWEIFCIGSATKNLVKENFGESSIAGTADSASTLAEMIIAKKKTEPVIFFCGNQRRNELPGKLSHHGIKAEEIVVYKTIESSHQIKIDYDAIIFYSPSAVNSFFSINKIKKQTILFAIGNTTANEIKKYADNKIVVAKEPSKELLGEQALSYFEANPITH